MVMNKQKTRTNVTNKGISQFIIEAISKQKIDIKIKNSVKEVRRRTIFEFKAKNRGQITLLNFQITHQNFEMRI